MMRQSPINLESLEMLPMPEDEAIFCEKWVKSELHEIIEGGLRSVVWFIPVFYIYTFFRIPRSIFLEFLGLTLIGMPVLLLAFYGVQKKIVTSYIAWMPVEITYELIIILAFLDLSKSQMGLSEYLNMIYVFFGLAVYGIAMFPLPLISGIFTAAVGISLSFIGVYINPTLPFAQTTSVLCLGIGFAVAIRVNRYKNIQRESRLICESLKLYQNNESLKRQAIERELVHAEKIQDSFLPPPQSLQSPGIVAEFFQEKQGLLGGDWMSARFLPNGNLVGLVADVTGKGISASLVVHAVQSLWVQASYQDEFEPVAWMTKVNKVLLTMGTKSPHSLTMGLITIINQCLIYYSAGHVPLFIVRKGDNKVRALTGGGPILGTKDRIDINPVYFEWKEEDVISILLASDGVFSRGSRTSSQEVLSLFSKLHQGNKARPLEGLDGKDDKVLLHIRCKHDIRTIN